MKKKKSRNENLFNLKKSTENDRHLALKKPVILDDVYDYLVFSYDAEDKRFMIFDRRYNESFHLSKKMLDKLVVLQKHFEKLCNQNNCHAVSAWQWQASLKGKTKINWKPKFDRNKRAHWSVNTKGYVTH